jgi:hypothetical protein
VVNTELIPGDPSTTSSNNDMNLHPTPGRGVGRGIVSAISLTQVLGILEATRTAEKRRLKR